jgi:peptidoglycan/xylan/chitin deacetylase (PgdA/CDA1 family)
MLDGGLVRILSRNKLSVFLFHKVPQELNPLVPGETTFSIFENSLRFISENFQIIPLDDAVKCLSERRLTERTACITFDDGYSDWMLGAVPLLEQMNLHATFFITTGQYSGLPMWNERILNAIRSAEIDQVFLLDSGLPPLPTATVEQKIATISCLEQHFKYQSLAFRNEMLEQLESITGANPGVLSSMSVEQLRRLESRGFGIGAHTVNHPILRFCDSESTVFELGSAKETLEGIVGRRITAFAYPNGRPHVDFSSDTIRLVKSAGYEYAMTTDWGVADVETPLHQIPRFTPWGPDAIKMKFQILRNLIKKPVYMAE